MNIFLRVFAADITKLWFFLRDFQFFISKNIKHTKKIFFILQTKFMEKWNAAMVFNQITRICGWQCQMWLQQVSLCLNYYLRRKKIMCLNKSSELLLLNYNFSDLERFYENLRLTDPKIVENHLSGLFFLIWILFDNFFMKTFISDGPNHRKSRMVT